MIGAYDPIMKADAGPELRHLRALRAVVEEGSFAGAAAVLGCSQPAVSQGRSPSWRRTLVFPSFIAAHCDRPMWDGSSWQLAMRL
jgi:Bacterial regulatory helix-turn-helix protein, lysR family